MARLSLSLLGSFQALLDGEPITGFESMRVRALLIYLAVEKVRPHRRETLVELFWPDQPSGVGAANLRHALANLRKAIGDQSATPSFLLITPATLQFNAASDTVIDLDRFTAGLTNHPSPADLQEALALYRGRVLEGFALNNSPDFELWLTALRERIDYLAGQALAQLVSDTVQQGDFAQAAAWTQRQLALDALNEDLHLQLIWLLAHSGQRTAALHHYDLCRHLLQQELDIEPQAALQTLVAHIHSGNPDLGMVHGQDGQLLRLPSPMSIPPTHLPTPLTPFIGREAELALLAERLADPACRLLTIVGPGGSGKTRLAIQAAGRATSHFPQGICFVDLVPVATVDQLPNVILTALGTQRYGSTNPLHELLDYLQPRRLLLVLDNFEHLLTGSDLLVELLQAAPQLKIWVTSRTRLHLREEWLIPLDGLALPSSTDAHLLFAQKLATAVADVEHYAASCLFLQCVRRLQPAFQPTPAEAATILQICQHLAGIPLGIELAAAWVRALPLAAIAREISHNLTLLQASFSDMPERHRSMSAVFDHSWALLTAHECNILRQFAVFRGGATRAACEAVTGATLADLAALVDHSWLRLRADERYEMHELVRQYCEEKLTSEQQTNGETRDLVRSRHGAYFTDYLAGALARMNYQLEAMPEVLAELGNVLAGLQWAAQTGNVEAAKQMIIGLFFIAEMRGGYHFVLQTYDAAATLTEQTPAGEVCAHNRTLILCWLRWCQASLYRTLGQLERAAAEAEQILVLLADVAESRHQQWLCLMTHWIQAQLTHLRGDLLSARQQVQAMLIRFQEHNFPALFYESAREAQFFQAHAYALLGQIAWQLGDHDEAQQQMTQALALRDAIGEQRYKALNLLTLATIHQTVGEQQQACCYVQQALQISQADGDAITHAHALVALARLEREQGAYVLAQTHGEASLALGRQSGNHRLLMETLVELGNIALALGQTAEAQGWFDEALTTFSRLGTAHSNYVAGVLLGLGRTALAKQEYSRAATYFQQTVAAKGVAAIERQEAIEGLSTIAKSEAEWAPLLY